LKRKRDLEPFLKTPFTAYYRLQRDETFTCALTTRNKIAEYIVENETTLGSIKLIYRVKFFCIIICSLFISWIYFTFHLKVQQVSLRLKQTFKTVINY